MDSRKLSMESVTRFEAQKVEQIRKDARRETLEEVMERVPVCAPEDTRWASLWLWLWAELEKVK